MSNSKSNKIFQLILVQKPLNINEYFSHFLFPYSELQNASGEWMNRENIQTPPRRSSITQPGYIPTADIIKKSISRSWTISSK